MIKFAVNKVYYATSICNHQAVFTYRVLSRTAKTVTLTGDSLDHGPQRFKIAEHDDAETVKPLGSYSMAPILRASRPVQV